MSSDELRVVVVGAGPTGLTMAYVLVRAGVEVSVVEAATGPDRESSRATTLHAGTLETLDRYDGLGEEIADRGCWAAKSLAWSGRRRLATIHWDRMPTRYAALVNVPQADIERVLRQRLLGCGVEVTWGSRVSDVGSLDADYVVGCDGAHSVVRAHIGAQLTGTTFEERFLLADIELEGELEDDRTHIWASTSGALGLMPLPDGVVRLNMTLADDETVDADNLGHAMSRRLGASRDRFRLSGVRVSAEYRTHARLASHYRRGSVFIAGDAAHLNSPIGGQGMNVGICDAANLGDKLAAVNRGGSPDILDAYETERRPIADNVIAMTARATRMFLARAPAERLVRNQFMRLAHRLPPVQRQLTTDTAYLASDRSNTRSTATMPAPT